MELNKQVSIESLILANHVESVNGLLYISGGGWTTHHRVFPPGSPPLLSHLGLALIIAVPWHQTNQNHNLVIEIRDEDAKPMVNITAQLNVGRLPGMRPGTIQYPTIALPMNITFPHAGGYEIVTSIADVDDSERRWAFDVNDVQQLAASA